MEQKAKTRALLAAFGCALAYLLAGKVLAFLPAPAWDVRALSFVLGTLRSRTGSVWPGMLLHTLNNLLVFAAG